MFKQLGNWIIEAIKETLNLSWTLVGLVIATLTLTGSAQQVTGLATIVTLAIWLLTIGFRKWEYNMSDKKLQYLIEELLTIEKDGKKVFTPTVMLNGETPIVTGLSSNIPLYLNAKKDGEVRARDEEGKFVSDDITTADNEAWENPKEGTE